MKFRFILLLLFLISNKSFAVIEVDITRGNLSPLPVAVSPLAVDKEDKKSFEKIIKKKRYRSRNFYSS